MIRSLIAVLILSFISARDYYAGDALIKKGVNAFYDYQFDLAIDILSDARQQFPEHPGVHLIWAASRWVRSQAFLSIDDTYDVLQNDLDSITPIYEKLLEKYDYDPNYKLYYGSVLGLSARVSLGKKQWIKTLYRSYKGFKIIKKVANESPGIIDSQLPIGIVEYLAGISNPIIGWAVKLYDLEASTESGLRRMSIAADDGIWSWIESRAILSNLYLWVENEPILSLEYSQGLARDFPNNFYFNLLYLESMIRTNKLSESKDIIKDMEKGLSQLTSRQREWYQPYLTYEIALLAFFQKEYIKALELVNAAIKNYSAELDIILSNAYLLQGMIYDKINERAKAKESYRDCIGLDNFSYSIEKAKLHLKIPF
ncbi:MAG: hypothetical protein CMG60_03525 [Candidatus Marinimicrobia bacterium]|nr:hypothetical protein [Candidatus Neomarinimicrobiota bacterium]|tara:strand:+ start:1465 stop:2574 length:1110 start_codon:yes stop_codon:yes gene_type:complete